MLTRLFPASLVLAGAVAGAALAEPAVLNGAAAYRERMAPPPDAELVVQLQHLSGGEARLVSESRQALAAVPAEFRVPYDTADVDPAQDYAAVAWIEAGGRVLWRTAEPHPVLVDGASAGVDLQLKRVLSNVTAPAPAPEDAAADEAADDAAEAETATPPATEAEEESEVAATGAAVTAPPSGAATARPPAEGQSALAATGAGAAAAPGSEAGDGGVPPELIGGWQVEDIGGMGVVDASRTTLAFDGSGRAAGVGGCNRFTGEATFGEDGALGFGAVAATRMACVPALMDQEQKFFEALQAVRGWRMEGPFLFLVDEDGADLARLIRSEG